jgi:drug/metabolite transporter (DMT)-like permease
MNLSAKQVGVLEMSTAMVLSGFIGFFVVESGQSVWNVIFFRCLFGALGLTLYCWWRGFLSPWPLRGKKAYVALLAALALVLNWVLLFNAYSYVSISLATVVYNTQPFFLLLAASLFIGDKIGLSKLPWFLIAFLGLLLIVELSSSDFAGDKQILGFAMALGAAVLYAINTLLTKQLVGVRPELTALTNTLVGMGILLPIVDFSALPQELLNWGYLVILGVVHTCLMYILMYSSYQKLPITIIAILAFLYPAVAILVDMFVYGQSLTIYQWLGVILILLSVTGLNLDWNIKSLVRKQ